MRSVLLVTGQFGSIAVLLCGGRWTMASWAWALFATGLTIFFWAVVSLGGRNFSILPTPRQGNELSERGIYRFLRHPMYTAVLVCGLGVTLGAPSVWRSIALPVCALVLLLKISYEERLLSARHPDYPQRMKRVARLFPCIW